MLPATEGSTTTRLKDEVSKTGLSGSINSEEGTLFVEMAAFSDDSSSKLISLNDGTTSNKIEFGYFGGNSIFVNLWVGGVSQGYLSHTVDITQVNKIAYKYELNDTSLWLNGVEVATDNSATMPVGLNSFDFDNGVGINRFYGKVKQLQVFKTALTDEELATLTTL